MEHKFTNHLIHESSPYLLQHAHNPVDWYPWGNEALEKALNENKLIIISIGYAACHWCHVMEGESFEDEEVANFMNKNFVSIKVDREERPDIDQVYMSAIQALSGSGGWPLNCIALPDGKPIYGGTYFSKSQWLEMLENLSVWVKENQEKAKEQGNALTQSIKFKKQIHSNSENTVYKIDHLDRIFNKWENEIDFIYGGHKRAPKFPLPQGLQYLLHYHHISGNQSALNAVLISLQKMADGGIYDQIGGGFARYSTDIYWKVPHFEKMLYDNAQLVSLYATAYQITKNIYYKTIVEETLVFIKRELTSTSAGFYASLDADSEGEEGKFYVWTKAELQKILGNESEMILDYYNITDKGNWEDGVNILFKSESDAVIAEKYKLTENEFSLQIADVKSKLLKVRNQRIHPGLDDKILTAWNALMIKAYTDAYKVFDHAEYLETAIRNADFIISKLKASDHRLYRSYKNGKSTINAFLDDYAFTIAGLISLYQQSFDEKWIFEALELCKYSLIHFYDIESGMFYYTSDEDTALISRQIDESDNVIPSSNSEMAKNLFLLGHYFSNDDYIQKSGNMLNQVKHNAKEYGAYYANWDILMAWFASEPYEVVIVGDDAEAKRKEFNQVYLPNVIIAGSKVQGNIPLLVNKLIPGETLIYVCRNKSCQQPQNEVKNALKLIFNK
ncbi:MAG: thioredoxin domain-containing protein [Bacteroidales bacterium]